MCCRVLMVVRTWAGLFKACFTLVQGLSNWLMFILTFDQDFNFYCNTRAKSVLLEILTKWQTVSVVLYFLGHHSLIKTKKQTDVFIKHQQIIIITINRNIKTSIPCCCSDRNRNRVALKILCCRVDWHIWRTCCCKLSIGKLRFIVYLPRVPPPTNN